MHAVSLLVLAAAVAPAGGRAVTQDVDASPQLVHLEGPSAAAAAEADSSTVPAATLVGPAQEPKAQDPTTEQIVSTLWGALVEAVCFFLSLATVRIASSTLAKEVLLQAQVRPLFSAALEARRSRGQ
eukprot:CAMPEP_0179143924 /NCGR_PEP_ID=MMETSP0796-20121207/69270_1 /TAXON_ID=73915 /ORGANISM="Pyrodinium bahamense, Strain pbaha01" /LENGTH=126 /DNA_ID=CAMNT_0020844029 /DNA_START=95 /DNA_END=471 /DNA_ORIENTATION=-